MAARKGMPSFTRGGMPVSAHPEGGGKKGPRRGRSSVTGTTNYAEPIAWGIAGGLTVAATSLIGAGLASGLGNGGDGRFGNKKR